MLLPDSASATVAGGDGIGTPVARINWAIPTALCTPTALAQGHGEHVLGNQGGPTSRLRCLRDAGFTGGRLALDTGQNLVLTAVADG